MKKGFVRFALSSFAALALAVFGGKGIAVAELIYSTEITVFGTGLGAVNTLVTVHDPGGSGNQNGTESGCINQDGSFTSCLGAVEGGDNTAINNVLTFNTDNNFAAVVNIAEEGQDLSVTVTDLYLTFCDASDATDCHDAIYNGADLTVTQGTGTGLGGSGFTFILSDVEYALVQALGPIVTVSGGVQFLNGSTNDGNDTVHVIQFVPNPGPGPGNEGPGPGQQIPEPTTLILLGSGLLLVRRATRRFGRLSK
jgi:hypothetical protein